MKLELLEKKFYHNHEKKYFFALANAYREHNMLDKCIGVFQRGLYLFPKYWAARVAYARALFEKGDLEGALEELKTAACHVPENQLLHELLASIYFKKGDTQKAVHHSKIVLFVNPCHAVCQSIMDEALKNQQKEYQQQPAYKKEKDHSPINEEQEIVTATLAELYVSQGVREKAIAIYQKLIVQQPEKKGKWINRINALQEETVQVISSEFPTQKSPKGEGDIESIIQQLEGWLKNIEKNNKNNDCFCH